MVPRTNLATNGRRYRICGVPKSCNTPGCAAWQVTGDALDFALTTLNIADAGLRDRLMHLYLGLAAYPEVPETLQRLKAGGMKLAILSNGTPKMLASAVRNAGLDNLFDAVLSVEEVGVYKPHPSVYQLAADRLRLPPGENMLSIFE